MTASSGNIYHHQMSTLIDDRYVGVWNHISSEYWIDFGPAGELYDTPVVVSKGGTYEGSFKGSLGMANGATEYVKDNTTYALKVVSGGCYITTNYEKKSMTKLFDVEFGGTPTVCGDYLVVCDRVNGKIAIYVIETGTLLGIISVDGNPDIAYADGTMIYIPLGYQGLLKIDTTKAFD